MVTSFKKIMAGGSFLVLRVKGKIVLDRREEKSWATLSCFMWTLTNTWAGHVLMMTSEL